MNVEILSRLTLPHRVVPEPGVWRRGDVPTHLAHSPTLLRTSDMENRVEAQQLGLFAGRRTATRLTETDRRASAITDVG